MLTPVLGSRSQDNNHEWLVTLCAVDSRHEKERIEDIKGPLIRDSYFWVLENSAFRQWRSGNMGRLLWVTGDPGKGKTMLLCGIINELSQSNPKQGSTDTIMSFFLCQGTDSSLNTAVAVVGGLARCLAAQDPALIPHIEDTMKEYGHSSGKLFEGRHPWLPLSKILKKMLRHRRSNKTYLIIDALDECQTDLLKLLDFVIEVSSEFPRVRWILSSRNSPSIIEEKLGNAQQTVRLNLELHGQKIASAVRAYINENLEKLFKLKHFSSETERNQTKIDVEHQLISRSNDTFLWVALACNHLEEVPPYKLLEELNTLPRGLEELYEEMMTRIRRSKPAYGAIYRRIIAVVSTVFRPITLHELASLVPTKYKVEYLRKEVESCGTFLTLNGSTVYFVHESAKDFFLERPDEIFPSGKEDIHHGIFSQSMRAMSQTLRRDIYDLGCPDITSDKVKKPDPDPLATIHYSCLYWVDHLLESGNDHAAEDGAFIRTFLSCVFLYWLESLSLGRNLSTGVLAMNKLHNALAAKKSQHLPLAEDARRFLLYWRSDIEIRPLQLYYSALIFSPRKSLIRESFEKNEIEWVNTQGGMIEWPALLLTLHGKSESPIMSIAFSPDGQRLATGAAGGWIQQWDATTGELLQTFQCSDKEVDALVFLPGGQCLASGSGDERIRIWDAASGALLQTLAGESKPVRLRTSSSDGSRLVLESPRGQNTAQLWDVCASALLRSLDSAEKVADSEALLSQAKPLGCSSGTSWVESSFDKLLSSMYVLPSALFLAFGHWAGMLGLLLMTARALVLAIAGESYIVSLVFLVASATAQLIVTHVVTYFHRARKLSFEIAFSPGNRTIAFGDRPNLVELRDADTGLSMQIFAYKPESESGSTQVRWIHFLHIHVTTSWGLYHGRRQLSKDFLTSAMTCWVCLFSLVPLWTLSEADSWGPRPIVFSPNGKLLASETPSRSIRLSDAATGTLRQTFPIQAEACRSLSFSPDSRRLASGSSGGIIHIWQVATSRHRHGDADAPIMFVAFSPGGEYLVSSLQHGTAQLWNPATGTMLRTFGFTPLLDYMYPYHKYPDIYGFSIAVLATNQTKLLSLEHLRVLASSPDGETFAWSAGGVVSIWRGRKKKWPLEFTKSWERVVVIYCFLCFGSTVLCADWELWGLVELVLILFGTWSFNVFRPLGEHSLIFSKEAEEADKVVENHDGKIGSVAFSPDGKRLISASSDTVIVLTLTNNENHLQERVYSAKTSSLSFLADSKMITDRGIVDLETLAHQPSQSDQPDQLQTREEKWEGWGFSKDWRWITWKGKNIIRLPPLYTPQSVAVAEWKVAIGSKSGYTVMLNFSPDEDVDRFFNKRI